MSEVFDEPVAEEVPPEPEEEPQFADDYDEDEPETLTTADLLVNSCQCKSLRYSVAVYVKQVDNIRLFGDYQGLHEVNPAAAALEESNALALAIVPPSKLDAAELTLQICSTATQPVT
jgi:hypothetical protein